MELIQRLQHKRRLQKEGQTFAQIIRADYKRLGYGDVPLRVVGLDENKWVISIQPSQKTWRGYKWMLAKNVRVQNLLNSGVIFQIAASCQRMVTTRYTSENEAQLLVHRLEAE